MLLLAGCANTQSPPDTTEKKPGWSVSGSEPGDATQSSELTDEELLEQDQNQEQMEPEFDEEGNPIISGNAGGGSGGSGESGNAGGIHISENLSLSERRDVVEAEMRHMMSVLWTPAKDVVYSISGSSGGLESDLVNKPDYIVRLYAGRIYQGMPYAHGCSSSYSFLDQTIRTENGIPVLDLTTADLSGSSEGSYQRRARLSNNCADAVFWAWAKVASSITFSQTVNMTQSYGCLKVGDYTYDNSTYKGTKTVDVIAANGQDKMLECYALMQKGDAMVRWTGSAGHAIMVVDVEVVRDARGKVDPKESYAIILDQGSDCEKAEKTIQHPTYGTVYICEELDKKKSFASLLKSGYLPVTCKELVDESPLEEAKVTDSVANPSVDNMFSGEFRSNYRISSVTVTIKDKKGSAVQSATCYAKEIEMYSFQLTRLDDDVEQDVMKGSLDIGSLPAGEYTCTYTCQVSTGQSFTVRQFTFTK